MDKRLKVAEVITRLDWGGSPDIVRLICTMSDPEVFDIRLITGASTHSSIQTKEFKKRFNDKIKVIPSLKRDIDIINDFKAFKELYRLFKKERFDIVHTHTAKAGALGRMAARLAGVPKIIHMPHGHNYYGYFGPIGSLLVILAEKFLTLFTDTTMAFTELEKKDMMRFRVSAPEKIVIINSGVELGKFKDGLTDVDRMRENLRIKPGERIVGMISRLEPVKGPQYFIEAAKPVLDRFPDVKFLVVGDGSLRAGLELSTEKLRIKEKVIFAGWREDVPHILHILDLLVLPSLNEAVGRILLEAGASGVPAVASSVGGIPEVIKDNETGILVPPKSSEALAQAIITLLNDDEKRKRMGVAAKSWADDRFSADRMVRKIQELYGGSG